MNSSRRSFSFCSAACGPPISATSALTSGSSTSPRRAAASCSTLPVSALSAVLLLVSGKVSYLPKNPVEPHLPAGRDWSCCCSWSWSSFDTVRCSCVPVDSVHHCRRFHRDEPEGKDLYTTKPYVRMKSGFLREAIKSFWVVPEGISATFRRLFRSLAISVLVPLILKLFVTLSYQVTLRYQVTFSNQVTYRNRLIKRRVEFNKLVVCSHP